MLDATFVELGDLDLWAQSAIDDGETELIVDLVSVAPVGVDVLSNLARLRRRLDAAGVRMALVCSVSDAAVLRLGHFERAYVLATSPEAATDGLRATRPVAGVT